MAEKSLPSNPTSTKDRRAKQGAKKPLRRKRKRRRRRKHNGGTVVGNKRKNRKGLRRKKGGGKRRKRRRRRKNDANTVTRLESKAAEAFPPNGLSTGDDDLYDQAFDTWDDEAFEKAHHSKIKSPSRSHAHVVEIFKD